ncbi:hypothetical protein PPSIR1_14260 [Plesiocystis pacifica SIR-1]|uniref:Lipoprotein n=1 Tax=Plesiocystis pacifica SIR-1 TaxID=391625 RepID=A6GH30_9BACT|nr:hypothetical protein PPSIR1_14260 [Plesiocystis pacifica SIR-1]
MVRDNSLHALSALSLASVLALTLAGCGETEPEPEPEGPKVEASAKGDLQWKRADALERDLAGALELGTDELCVEVGVAPCIQEVHLVALGGHDPIDLGLYESLDEPLTTTPIALDRVVLSACIARASADAELGPDAAVVFGSLDLAGEAPASGSEAVAELTQTLTRRLFARDPLAEEVALIGELTVDGEGGRVSAEDFAILACHSLGTTSEFLMF